MMQKMPETPHKTNTLKSPSHIIGVGASAGGLMALEAFFKQVPLKTGLAFVVIQHLPPDHKSMMAELLARHTQLSILYIQDDMPVAPDSIYLIPPGYNITLFHNRFLLSRHKNHPRQLNLPIDTFLASLAEDQEDKAMAVILSGTGSDGSRGVRHIKEKFGIVLAQDPASAQFDGMPGNAIETGTVDFILPPEQMAQQILTCIRHPFARQVTRKPGIIVDETGLTRIFSLLRETHRLDFTYYKQATVLRRIERRMTINQMHELGDYITFIENHPKEITTLYNELLIGVTSFFRDPDAYLFLAKQVLPKLFSEYGKHDIRFWVEGCSSGEEAYSLAILCHECMETMKKQVPVKIFATDVDKRAVSRASEGHYPESITADLTPGQLVKYFVKKEGSYQISRQIREMVVFARHNILKDPPFTRIDLVSCRNLLIYLQPVLQKRALEKFNFSLRPGGILFLGASESIGEMHYYFDALSHKWKIFSSRGKRSRIDGMNDLYVPERYERKALHPHHGPAVSLVHERTQEKLLQALARRYVDLTVLVNADNEILHVLGDTEKFLKFPSGKPVNQISKILVKEMVVPVTAGLQKVFKDNVPVMYSQIYIQRDSIVTTAKMEIHPIAVKADEQALAAIFIEDIKSGPGTQNQDVQEIDIHFEKRVEYLEDELQFTRESLQTTIEELETSNEELGATNEELMASNEELQSTNEELQSVNQELYTVNAEYQGKNLELIEIKNDLENLFANLQIPVMFLDENLEIRQFTPQINTLFNITPKDAGRPLDHLVHNFKGFDLTATLRTAMAEKTIVDQEVITTDNRRFLMKLYPYKVSKNYTSGAVVIFVDINHLPKTCI
ncbi:MAG: chemotaxis protein CheB [Desulfotignum sp.]